MTGKIVSWEEEVFGDSSIIPARERETSGDVVRRSPMQPYHGQKTETLSIPEMVMATQSADIKGGTTIIAGGDVTITYTDSRQLDKSTDTTHNTVERTREYLMEVEPVDPEGMKTLLQNLVLLMVGITMFGMIWMWMTNRTPQTPNGYPPIERSK